MGLKDMNAQQRFDLVNGLEEAGKCCFYKLWDFEERYPQFRENYDFSFITYSIMYVGSDIIPSDIKEVLENGLLGCVSRAY